MLLLLFVLFLKEATQPADYLREMQCMWFETESANAYRRLHKFGESLKKCHQVERVNKNNMIILGLLIEIIQENRENPRI